MAKSDSFFGLRRGSTKTLTFSVLKGKQITKDRVEGGRNPRTPEQMVQRMCMATASAAYAQMKQIVDHSFEGITYGQTTMSEFIRVNAEALRKNFYESDGFHREYDFSYNPYRDRNTYFGNYIMSRGTASPIPSKYQLDAAFDEGSSVPDKLDLIIGSVSGTMTFDAVLALLGIKVGELCTFVGLFEDDTDASAKFFFIRLTALASGDTVLTASNFNTLFKVEGNVPIENINVQAAGFTIRFTAENFVEGNKLVVAIHSLKQNGKWLRSNAQFANLREPASPTPEDALDTYPVGPSYVLNGGQVEG